MHIPFYQPWLTVFCGVITAVAIILANSACTNMVPAIVLIVSIVIVVVLKLPRQIVFLSLLFVCAFVYAKIRSPGPGPTNISQYLDRTVVVTGYVLKNDETSQGVSSGMHCLQIQVLSLVFPQRKNVSGRAHLSVISLRNEIPGSYAPGEILQIKGQVQSIEGSEQPWLSGLVNFYARQNIFCQIRAFKNDITVLAREKSTMDANEVIRSRVTQCIGEMRERLTEAHIRFLGTKVGGLLASMILGDQAITLDPELIDAFKKVGLSHIVAASGFNLAVVTIVVYWFSQLICSNKKLVTFIVLCNVFIYAILAGLSSSIVRATIICTLVLVCKYFHRCLHRMAAVSMGLMINIIIDPSVVIEPGGQLSYAATMGIIGGAESIAEIFAQNNSHKIVKICSSSLGVVLMAQLAVLPVQLFHFCQTGLLFLPANLLVDPMVTPLTIAGFLASVIGIINLPNLSLGLTICRYVDLATSVPLNIIIYITEKLAACDAAIVNTGSPLTIAIVFYYIMLVFWLICLKKSYYRLCATIVFITSLLLLFYQPKLERPVVIIVPRSIICVNENRKALCFGSSSRLTNKILAYYGAGKSSEKTMLLSTANQMKIVVQKIGSDDLLLIADQGNQQDVKPIRSIYGVRFVARRFSRQQLGRMPNCSRYLSRNQLRAKLRPIEFKICCPSVRFYSIGNEGTSFSSSAL
jgi:competence protein ComEC